MAFGLTALQCALWAPWSLLTIESGPTSNKTLKKKRQKSQRVDSAVLHTLRTAASQSAGISSAGCGSVPAPTCTRVPGSTPFLGEGFNPSFAFLCTKHYRSGLLKRETFIHLEASSTSSLPHRSRKLLPKHTAVPLSHLETMLSGTASFTAGYGSNGDKYRTESGRPCGNTEWY